MLVSENGGGKTAILEAIRILAGRFINVFAKQELWRDVDIGDLRLAKDESGKVATVGPTILSSLGVIDGSAASWNVLSGHNYEKNCISSTWHDTELTVGAKRVLDPKYSVVSAMPSQPITKPLLAYYTASRFWNSDWSTFTLTRPEKADYGVPVTCASDTSLSYDALVDWYNTIVSGTHSLHNWQTPESVVGAVRDAARTVMEPSGWQGIEWVTIPTGAPDVTGMLCSEHPEFGLLPMGFLAEGVRNTIALVADFALRCRRLNAQFGHEAAKLTPGLLLIDEIDAHLHPRWQQTIIESLQTAFPMMQIIVTTHSPHVLSTVDKASIRIINVDENGIGTAVAPKYQTRGVSSADVLAEIMGVYPVPMVPESEELNLYQSMIEDGDADTPEAQSLRTKLVAHFGHDHPLMRNCDRLIHFQEFKRNTHGEATPNAKA